MECKRIHLIEVKNFGRAIDPAKDIAAFFEVKKMAAEMLMWSHYAQNHRFGLMFILARR